MLFTVIIKILQIKIPDPIFWVGVVLAPLAGAWLGRII